MLARRGYRSFDDLDLIAGPGMTRTRSLFIESNSYNPINTPTLPFIYASGRWIRSSASRFVLKPRSPQSHIQLITWNVDCHSPDPYARLEAILDYLEELLLRKSSTIINLQGVNFFAFPALLNHTWVQDYFQLTDIKLPNHPRASYATVSLISHDLSVVQIYRSPFLNSDMNRDLLLVDILAVPHTRRVLRVANTHLESRIGRAEERYEQLRAVGRYLRQPEVLAGVVAADINTVGVDEFDLPSEPAINMYDAYTLNGRSEEAGYTWGFQSGWRVRHSRRDRILYTGPGVSFVPGRNPMEKVVRRIGKGLLTNDFDEYASDHFGVMVDVAVRDDVAEMGRVGLRRRHSRYLL